MFAIFINNLKRFLSLLILFNFFNLIPQDFDFENFNPELFNPDLMDYSGFSDDLTVSWDDTVPTSFEPDMPEEIKEDLAKPQDVVVNIPFFGYVVVSKTEDRSGNKIWKVVPEVKQRVVKLGDNITFSDFDLDIDKNKKLSFSAKTDIYGTQGKASLSKAKFGSKGSKLVTIFGSKFIFDFVNKPVFKPFAGAQITADKIELGIEKNLVELSANFKNAQVAEFGKVDNGIIRLTRQRGGKLTVNITGDGTLSLPEIGQVSYKLTTSVNSSGNLLFKAALKDINYNDISLKKVKAVFNTETKELKLKGVADILGFYVVVTLKRDSGGGWKVTGKVNKDTLLDIPFLDGRILKFTDLEFVYDSNKKQAQIKASSKLDITPIVLTLIAGKRVSAQFEISDTQISQLVPSATDTDAGNVKIHKILGKITSGKTDIFKPKTKSAKAYKSVDPDFDDYFIPDYDFSEYEASEEGLEFFFTGAANLSAVVPQMQNLDVMVTVSAGPKLGFHLTSEIEGIEIPEFGKIHNAKAFISIPSCGAKVIEKPKKKESTGSILSADRDKEKIKPCEGLSVGISGQGETTLPHIGNVKYSLSSMIVKNALMLKAELGDIYYEGLKIQKALASFNTKTKDFEITGEANLLRGDINTVKKSSNITDSFNIKVSLSRNTLEKTTEQYYKFSGVLEGEIKPLKNVPVSLLNGSVKIDNKPEEISFTLNGDIKIEDHVLTSTTTYKRNGESEILSMKTKLFDAGPKAKNWSLGSFAPMFKNTPFDSLRLSSAELVISSDSYYDEISEEQYTAGITLVGDFDDFIVFGNSLKGALANSKTKAKVYGALNLQDLRSSSIGAKFDVGLKDTNKNSKIKSGGLTLAISGKPSVLFIFNILVDIDPTRDPLGFNFSLDLDVKTTIEISGDMDGCWVEPFKIPGVSVCDLGLSLGINIPQLIATGLPSGFGIKGAIEVPGTSGKKKFIVAIAVDSVSPEQNHLVAELNGELSLLDIINIVFELADGAAKKIAKAQGKKLATTGTIDLKNVPTLSIKDVLLKIVPPGQSVTIGSEVYDPGFTLRGKLNIFGKNALVNIETSEFGASGDGYLEKIEIKDVFLLTGAGPDKTYGTADDGARVSVALTPFDQHVEISGKVAIGPEAFRILQSETNIYISALEGLKFSSQSSLFGTDIIASMTVTIPGVADVLKDKDALLKSAIDIYFRNDFTDKLKVEILKGLEQAQKDLQKSADDANKAFDQAIKDLQNAKNAGINKANQDLNNLQNQLNDVQNQLNRLDKGNPANWAKAAELGTRVASLKVSVETGKQLVNKLGRPVLTATQEIIDQAGRQVSNSVLKGTNLIVQVGGKYVVVEGLLSSFVINEVFFHGSIGEIQNGQMPRLKLVLTITGKKYTLDGQFNFKDVGKSFEVLGNSIKDSIVKLFKK